MSGENSKNIGEYGERYVEKLIRKIGWNNPLKGQQISCIYGEEHALKNAKKGLKTVHGIDFLTSYRSKLEPDTGINLIISAKHKKDGKYPKSATDEFKGFISDLVHTTKCFDHSEKKDDYAYVLKGSKQIRDIPILIYLSSHVDDGEDADFISIVKSSNFMSPFEQQELYILDNKKVKFVLDAISFLEKKNEEWYFYHPIVNTNFSSTENRFSKCMQVEFLSSPFIPFVIKSDGNLKLLIVTSEDFSENLLMDYITYARNSSGDLISNIEIAVSDYYEDDHSYTVTKVLATLNDICEKDINLKVYNYKPNFRNLVDE